MKFTLKCKDPACLSHILGRVNVLNFQEFGSGTCLLSGYSWSMPDKVELTIDHKPGGYGGRYQLQSFHVIDGAQRRGPGRPPKDGPKDGATDVR